MVNIEDAPRLRELCEKASKEYDHEKLIELIRQINELLEKRRPSNEDAQKKLSPLVAPGGRAIVCLDPNWLELCWMTRPAVA
jgi:hypothetical protein